MTQHRVAVVTGIPAPYRQPVFARLAQRPGIDLKVFYCAHGHGDVGWSANGTDGGSQFAHEFVPNLTPARWQRLPMFGYGNVALWQRLRAFDPNYLIIYGYNQLAHWLTFRYCRRNRVPFALRSDSNVWLDVGSSLQNRIRRRLLYRLVSRCAAVLPVGTANREYWKGYGAADDQIFMAPYAVDNDRIGQLTADRSPTTPADGMRFIYIGRLIPRKAVDLLIEAFNRLCDSSVGPSRLTIVGTGVEESRLRALQSPAAKQRTLWAGQRSNDEAIGLLSRSDVFVLPSRYEPWGLVVNEAMAGAVPVIAHKHCGAALDLVEPGRTGWLLDDLTVGSLHAAMTDALAHPSRAARMGQNARQKIQAWSLDATVDGFIAAIAAGTAAPTAIATRSA